MDGVGGLNGRGLVFTRLQVASASPASLFGDPLFRAKSFTEMFNSPFMTKKVKVFYGTQMLAAPKFHWCL